MACGLFITGTDTDIGKTTIATGLMRALKNTGLRVAGFKPVSAGCITTESGLRNDDALQLMREASIELPYDVINPYAFEPAIAPHIAAADINVEMNIETIVQAYEVIAAEVDVVIVEGAGGWLVPFNETQTMADLATRLKLDVIQVVGMKLGCLSHAMLTSESICAHGLTQVGWIANHLQENMPRATENLHSLKTRLPSACLGEIPYLKQADSEQISNHLHIRQLVELIQITLQQR